MLLISLTLLLSFVAAAQPARPVPFEENGKWGYKSGRSVLISPRYVVAQEFSAERIAAVVDERGWAYIDRRGKVVIRPLVVDNGPDYFAEGLARFAEEGRVGFFNKYGLVVIPPRYSFAQPFSERRAAVCEGCREVLEGEHRIVRGGRWGYIDRGGRLVIPLRYDDAGAFKQGRARVRVGDRWDYIDLTGAVHP